jgi:hypothetical protein
MALNDEERRIMLTNDFLEKCLHVQMNQGISKIKPRVRHLINVKEPHFLHFEA